MKIINDTNEINTEEISQKTKIIFSENLKFDDIMEMESNKKTINFVEQKIKLIFTSNESLDIINFYDFKYKGTITLSFKFKSIKNQLSLLKFDSLLESIRNLNEGQVINLHFSSSFIYDYNDNSKKNFLNVNQIKIDDVLYCFSLFELNKIFLNNTNFSSIILKNIKFNSNSQIQNLFDFLEKQKNLNFLKIENLYLELFDSQEQIILNYFQIINNQIYMIRKLENKETLLNINNFILKNAPLVNIINNEKANDNLSYITINQSSILSINFCGIIKYVYYNQKYYLSIDQNYFEDDTTMDIEKEDQRNFNNFQTFKKLIGNNNLKIYKLKLSNITKTFDVGNKESINEVYFNNCSSEVTQYIISQLPNLKNLKLKGINDLNCIIIPKSIIKLTINDSYINNSSLPNLQKINIILNSLKENEILFEQSNQYNITLESIKNILKEKNDNLKEIVLERNSIFLSFETNEESCFNKSNIIFKNCFINQKLFEKLNLNVNRQIFCINCSIENEKFLEPFQNITFDFYTYNNLIFKSYKKNDIEDYIKNLFLKEDTNLKFNYIDTKNKKIKINTKSNEEYRKMVLTFFIFKNESIFTSCKDIIDKFNEKIGNNIILWSKDRNNENIIYPVIWSDYYLSKEQINFIKGLNNIQIELKKK